MSDGPFKNLRLVKRWKKFAEAAYNDAFDQIECCSRASDAIVHDVLTDSFRALLSALKSYADQSQMDIDPLSSIERIFNGFSKDQFTDILHKEMAYRSINNCSLREVLEQALASSVSEQVNVSRTRILEECIYSCDIGEMKPGHLNRTIDRINSIFESLDRQNISEAILACNKYVFKEAVAKKNGLDEGPSL